MRNQIPANDRHLKEKITVSARPWDTACKFNIYRTPAMVGNEKPMLMEAGVTFFILVLEHLGCTTYFSCEGHPTGFYICFDAPLEIADKIQRAGWFTVERHNGKWIIRLPNRETITKDPKIATAEVVKRLLDTKRKRSLREAAKTWQTAFLKTNTNTNCC